MPPPASRSTLFSREKTRRHLRRIIALLWYITVGAFLISYAAMRLLILPIYDWAEFSAAPFVIDFIALVVVVSLWTAYLLRSQRCRLRYPKSPGEAIRRVFE